MSKISNTLVMLKLLQNHRKYTVNELAEKLEVTPRMVKSYKNDLEKAGIFIETIRGKDGGYILYDNMVLPRLQISKYDIETVKALKGKDLFLDKHLDILLDKLNYNHVATTILEKSLPDNIDFKDMLNQLSEACDKKVKVKIYYQSLNGEVKERIIHPCAIFVHSDDWEIASYCELRGEVRIFDLSRIKKYEILEESYVIN